jgi:hypothetical protein
MNRPKSLGVHATDRGWKETKVVLAKIVLAGEKNMGVQRRRS